MPKYRVDALEKFLVRTTYYVDAATPDEADALCRSGDVAYDAHSIEESDPADEEWVETLSVEEELADDRQPSGQLKG